MSQHWHLNNSEFRANFDSYVTAQILAGQKVTVQFVPEKRSLDQNSIIHAIYGDVAKQKEDESVRDITRHCKLHHGVPILRADDPDFCAMYDKAIKPNLNYEEKLQAMDYLPVTRNFSKAQATTYIDGVIREYTQQGIQIAMPEGL